MAQVWMHGRGRAEMRLWPGVGRRTVAWEEAACAGAGSSTWQHTIACVLGCIRAERGVS